VWTFPATAPFYSSHARSMDVSTASETQVKSETTDKPIESALPSVQRTRKSVVAFSLLALAINSTAVVCTIPSVAIDLPDPSALMAELLPREKAPAPIVPDPVVAALKDIQSAQQQHAAALLQNASSLQQNTALLQQDSTTLASLRQSITDEQVDVKKISSQLSMLIAKVDSLQNALSPEFTSSIPKGRARARLSAAYKRMARQPKPVGPVSVGGAPLTMAPAQGSIPSRSPES
jgi:septal ring factor EnvC (AmiA/AmiB activator)